jgi:hypothetical protein
VDGVRYLTVDQVIEFHAEALREFGGLDGIRSPHQVAAAVLMPQQSAFGEDAYPTIPEKAAAYGFFIAARDWGVAVLRVDGSIVWNGGQNGMMAADDLHTFVGIRAQ